MTRESEVVEAIDYFRNNGAASSTLDDVKRYILESRGYAKLPVTWEVGARAGLRALAAAKVIEKAGSDFYTFLPKVAANIENSAERLLERGMHTGIAVDKRIPPPKSPIRGGNGGGSTPPDDDSNGDEEEGAGFREVLAHPFLFSIEPIEFEGLIRSIGGRS
jgi:hypothetical protein